MYRPEPPDTTRREHAACGIGFLASRKGVAERRLVEIALDLCKQFDHRGAPGPARSSPAFQGVVR